MKRITGIAVTVLAVLGCSYVGSAGASDKVCAQIFSETALVESGAFDAIAERTPVEAANYKRTAIEACESSINVGRLGIGPEAVANMVAKSITSVDGTDSLLSVTRVDMMMSGWSVGAEQGR